MPAWLFGAWLQAPQLEGSSTAVGWQQAALSSEVKANAGQRAEGVHVLHIQAPATQQATQQRITWTRYVPSASSKAAYSLMAAGCTVAAWISISRATCARSKQWVQVHRGLSRLQLLMLCIHRARRGHALRQRSVAPAPASCASTHTISSTLQTLLCLSGNS